MLQSIRWEFLLDGEKEFFGRMVLFCESQLCHQVKSCSPCNIHSSRAPLLFAVCTASHEVLMVSVERVSGRSTWMTKEDAYMVKQRAIKHLGT